MVTCDLIVIGLGGVGSASAMHAADRSLQVVGLEQFNLGHNRGSSHGKTRVIRQAYFEHPDYVPLIKRAYELWDDLEQQTDQMLFLKTGLLEVGSSSGELITGVLEAARLHDLPVETLDRQNMLNDFPGFHIPAGMQAVFESNAGLLHVEKCVLAHLQQSRQLGADCRENETVVDWMSDGKSVRVTTDREQYSAGALIITAGAWAGKLLNHLGIRLQVMRKHQHWFKTTNSIYHLEQHCPTYFYDTGNGYYYGFPVLDDSGLKVAEHSGGELIADPTHLSHDLDSDELQRISRFLEKHLPELRGVHSEHEVCMYTMSPDEHFIVDLHPQFSNVAVAAGLSGHGFKFTSAIGELLVDLLASERHTYQLKFLGFQRLLESA